MFWGCVGAVALTLMFGAFAWAGGIILYELGTPDVGLAAAGYAARAQDASTIFTNPAGMTRLKSSQLEAGLQGLYGSAKFSADSNTGPQTGGDGGNAVGFLPGANFFYVHPLTEDLRVGFGTFSYFGLGVDYDDDWVGRYYVEDATLIGLTLMPAIAYRVNTWLSLGLGLNIMYGILNNKVAINNIDPRLSDGQIKLESNDWGFGVDLGVLLEPRKGTRFGIQYPSKVDLNFTDKPEFKNLGPSLSRILQARGLLDAKLNLGMSVPQTVMISGYHELSDRFALLANLGWQDWSSFGKVDVGIDSTTPTSLTKTIDYQDTWHAALGAQYRLTEAWCLSTGLAYDSSMVKDADRTPSVAVGEAYRFGLGAQYQWSESLTLGLAYEFLWSGDLKVDQSRPLAGRLSGEYENFNIHFFTVNLTWVF